MAVCSVQNEPSTFNRDIFSSHGKYRIILIKTTSPCWDMVDHIGLRCSNCEKTTGLSVKNANYKDMVTNFFNTVLQHVDFSCIT